jgi:hypothetical protein
VEAPKKDQKEQNPRVFGEVDGPARQSKVTYPAPPDAADKSARLKEILFGKGKPAVTVAAQEVSAPAASANAPADSAAAK